MSTGRALSRHALGISEVERGNHADLLEEFEVVELVPVFYELAVLGSPDVDGTHLDRVPGRRYSVERTSVRAAVELTSCKVPGRRERGAGCAAGATTAGAGRGREGRWPGGASGRWQAADFEQLEPERLELREHAIQRGAVGQRPGQHGVAAAGPGLQGGERGAYRLAQAAADTDAVPVCRAVGVGAGHGRTAHTLNRPAGGSTVIGTGTGVPS